MILALILSMGCTPLASQCIFQDSTFIPENSITTFDFVVNGLVDDDLSAGTNSICRVDLEFVHEYIGDLVITLTSPAGQVITLVGPEISTIGPTNLSTWNISFIPCTDIAMPDLGFADVFTNDQPWAILTPYNGSYYPNMGCFSDFNLGSANGIWKIEVTDEDAPATGSIKSISITFCDATGMVCLFCAPDGGSFNTNQIDICEGRQVPVAISTPIFTNGTPDPAMQSYTYLISDVDTIISFLSTLNTASLEAGSYSICGLSSSTQQFPEVNAILDTALLSDLPQIFMDNIICAALSSNCISLEVFAPPAITDIVENICAGDTVFYLNEIYTRQGTYIIPIDVGAVCDSTVRLRVNVNPINAVITVNDTLTCGGSAIDLSASASTIPSNPTYFWSSDLGNIISNPNLETIQVDEPGVYSLVVSDGFCSDSVSVIVLGDNSYPQIFTHGGTIDCNNPIINLRADIFPLGLGYTWRLNGGPIISNLQQITVNEAGTYSVEVTNAEGCTNIAFAEVLVDTMPPIIDISQINKNCQSQVLLLRTVGISGGGDFLWRLPDGTTRDSRAISASDAGFYVLEVSTPNGCRSIDSSFVDGDFTIPDVMTNIPDSLFCGLAGVDLNASSSSNIISYQWNGPNGYVANTQNITIFNDGTYQVTLIADNDCRIRDTVEVFTSDEVFDFTRFSDSLSCDKLTAIIGINSTTPLLFNWVEFPQISNNQSSITVDQAGTYNVILLDTISGCTQMTSIQARIDNQGPSFIILNDTITCAEPGAEISFIHTTTNRLLNGFEWTLIDGTKSMDSIIVVTEPGEVSIIVELENGCIRGTRVNIISDIIFPTVFIEENDIGCFDSVQITTVLIDSIQSYQWIGPNNFISDDQNPFVRDSGLYQLTVTDSNSCTNVVDVFITADTSPPVVIFMAEELTCIDTVVTLVTTPIDSIISYEWTYNNVVISMDSLIDVQDEDLGTYISIARGTNNCAATDTFLIETPIQPNIEIFADTVNCSDPNATFVASSSVASPIFAWTDFNNVLISDNNQAVISDGSIYQLVVTGLNGCTHDTSFSAVVDTISPMAIIEQLTEILCKERDVLLSGENSVSTMDSISFMWSADSGILLSGGNLPVAMVRDTGLYSLVVMDLKNGCTNTASIILLENPNSITEAYLSIQPPACPGDANAIIFLDSIVGGNGALFIETDSGISTDSSVVNISAGEYLLSIIDTIGCTFDTLVIVDTTAQSNINLGPDKDIFIGDTVHINLNTDIDSADIIRVFWITNEGTFIDSSCISCTNFILRPLITTTYTFFIENELGCILEDQITVFVREQGNIFVPNTFTPNNDQANDEAMIFYGPGIQNIIRFEIFDRYGSQVYGAYNFSINNPPITTGWDGTLDGVLVNPAVFAWYAIYELINPDGSASGGKVEKKKGNITLLR